MWIEIIIIVCIVLIVMLFTNTQQSHLPGCVCMKMQITHALVVQAQSMITIDIKYLSQKTHLKLSCGTFQHPWCPLVAPSSLMSQALSVWCAVLATLLGSTHLYLYLLLGVSNISHFVNLLNCLVFARHQPTQQKLGHSGLILVDSGYAILYDY